MIGTQPKAIECSPSQAMTNGLEQMHLCSMFMHLQSELCVTQIVQVTLNTLSSRSSRPTPS